MTLLLIDYLILQLFASMGNSESTDCCCGPQQNHQFETIVPSNLIAPKFIQEKLDDLKQALARTSSLAELNYYLTKLKIEEYSKDFLESICPIRKATVCLAFQQNSLWNIPLQTKMYNPKQNRFDHDLNRVFALEIGVLKTSGERIEQLFQHVGESNLQKLQALLLEKKFEQFSEFQYLQKLTDSIKGWKSMQDCFWRLEKQEDYKNTCRHLLYHFQSYVNCMNSQLSFCDVVSLSKSKYIYHYFLNQIASNDPELLEELYSFQNWFYEAESHVLYPGQTIILHNFTPFNPYFDNEGYYQEDTVRFNPPKGDQSSARVIVEFIVTPNRNTKEKVKFRHMEHLYYVPFTIFSIQNIQSRQGRLFVYLKQGNNQPIVNYLKESICIPQLKVSTSKAKQQLKILQQQYSKTLQSLYGEEFCQLQETTLMYYKQYIKNKVITKIEQESVPVLTKLQMQVCQSVAQVKLDEQATLQEMQSEIDQATVSQQQIKIMQKDLEIYIKKLSFEKLQNQIDSIDVFVNIKSLNISQSWLEKIECLHCFPNLLQLFAYSNQIKKLQGLQKNSNLKLLSLARNEIQVIENIGHLTHLRELYLTKNKLELASAHYLTNIRLGKLKMLTISFSNRADQCFEELMKRPPPKLKKLLINEGDQLTARTKNTIKRRLKNIQVQYIH